MVKIDWQEFSILDIYDVTNGLSKGREEFGYGYPFLTFKEVFYNYFVPEQLINLANSSENERKKCSIKRGDIFITRTSETFNELGITCVALKDYPDATFNGFTKRLRLKDDCCVEILPEYIAFYLKSSKFRNQILSLTTMTTRASLNNDMLKFLTIFIPDIQTQKMIADILKSLHDKIEINLKIIKTLEEIAITIFNSWFINFDPVKAKVKAKNAGEMKEGIVKAAMATIGGNINPNFSSYDQYSGLKLISELFPFSMKESELGEIPIGWEIKTISDTCYFQNGYAFKSNEMSHNKNDSYRVFKMGNITKGGGFNYSGSKDYFPKSKSEKLERYLIKKGDLLMCMTDMKNNVALLGHTALMDRDNEFMLNQRVGLLRSKDIKIINYPFLYKLTNSEDFIGDLRSRANSGVQVNLSTNEILNTKFVLPDEDIHFAYNKIAIELQEEIFVLETQSQTLNCLRDLLLPNLLVELPEIMSIKSLEDN